MLNLENAKNRIFDRVHRTGEEVKNDLPNWVERVVKDGAWKKAKDANGKPFDTVGEWLVSNYPLGPGVGSSRYAIKYEELIALCEDNFPDLCKMLKDNRPTRKRGGDHGNQYTGGKRDNGTDAKRTHGSNSRQYIEERLRREFKKIWKDYLAGVYPSARQAGIAAGFIKDSHDPLQRLRSNWNKASKKQRKEFLEWLESDEAK
jgi:hypothetical protein